MTAEHLLTVNEAAREFGVDKLNLVYAIRRRWLPTRFQSGHGPSPVYVIDREDMRTFIDSGRNDQIYVDSTHPEKPIKQPAEDAVSLGKLRRKLELRLEAKEAGCSLAEYLIMVGEEEEYA